MKTFIPNYYKDFKCIAQKCKHNCCIGWEIDIDEDTLSYYENLKGKFSRKIKQGIESNDDCACFRLDGKGRCAFLNEKNLCDIILNLGEESLCQICSDHPRFRNYYSNRIEMGLGLCCEEAGRIILEQNVPFSLVMLSDDGCEDDNNDTEFWDFRERLFKFLNDNTISLGEKIKIYSTYCDIKVPEFSKDKWVDLYLSLERLDDYWSVVLNQLKDSDISNVIIPDEYNKHFENLIKYFTYRHITVENDSEMIYFILTSYHMIELLCKMHIKNYGDLTSEDIIEYCRLYSSEIEYSDENIYKIIEVMYKNEP